jgi:tetrahydromethanopterin S-methyltransferase subunit F
LSTTVTTGADGIAIGFATPVPGSEIQPPTVCVTVYGPPVETVIEAVVSVVDHVRFDPVVVKVDVPQLSTTVTTGVDGVAVGFATPVPGSEIHPPTV